MKKSVSLVSFLTFGAAFAANPLLVTACGACHFADMTRLAIVLPR